MDFVHDCRAMLDEHGVLTVRNGVKIDKYLLTQPLIVLLPGGKQADVSTLAKTYIALEELKAEKAARTELRAVGAEAP